MENHIPKTEEEEGTAAGLACPQQRVLPDNEDKFAGIMGQKKYPKHFMLGVLSARTAGSVERKNGNVSKNSQLLHPEILPETVLNKDSCLSLWDRETKEMSSVDMIVVNPCSEEDIHVWMESVLLKQLEEPRGFWFPV
ncbi:hypothetical protein CRENBAI_005059 [Crenichthys baileyi]|uniref:Uncharacterized protein n=1 Tax=Crenichthys baileyi TaxID=28760 RepID=A0AAV9SKH9_9TELE